MGQYTAMTICPREFRKRVEGDPGEHIAGMVLRDLRVKGYHPAGDPMITWYKITQAEIDAGALEPFAGYSPLRAGDWRVQVVVNVTEDAEL